MGDSNRQISIKVSSVSEEYAIQILTQKNHSNGFNELFEKKYFLAPLSSWIFNFIEFYESPKAPNIIPHIWEQNWIFFITIIIYFFLW